MVAGSQTVIEAFTELAPKYEKSMDGELREIWGLGYDEFVESLMDSVLIKDGSLVLDVATGTARIPQAAASREEGKAHIVGLDLTPAMLQHAMANIRQQGLTSCIELVCGSGMTLPFGDGVFDVAVCALGLHHMGVPQALADLRRVLKCNGRLVLVAVGALPSWRSFWRGKLIKSVTFLYFSLTHRIPRARAELAAFANVYSAEEWHALLATQGFSRIEINVALKGRVFWYPDALIMRAERQ